MSDYNKKADLMQPAVISTEAEVDGEKERIYGTLNVNKTVSMNSIAVIGEETAETTMEPVSEKQEDLHVPRYMEPAKIQIRIYTLKK